MLHIICCLLVDFRVEILKQFDYSGFQNDNTSFILKQYFKIENSYLFDLSKKLINLPDF